MKNYFIDLDEKLRKEEIKKFEEAYEKKEGKNNKKSYKFLALGLIFGFLIGVCLAIAYSLQQKPEVKTEIVTETIMKTETLTIPKTETIIKNVTTTIITIKNQTFWGIDLFGNFSQDVLTSYYVRNLKGKTYKFDPKKAGEIGRKFYSEYNNIIPKNASEFSKIKDDLIVYALSPELYSKIKDATPENKTIQKAIVNGFLSDKILTPEEKDQIKFLASFPKEEILKLIGNGSYVNTDMDGDGMNNYFEKEIAGLPWNVYNGRYILLLCTHKGEYYIPEIRKFFITHYKCLPQNVVELIDSNATFNNFAKTISDWEHKVTKNDIVFIQLVGHGNVGIFEFNDKVVKYEEINEYLNKLQPMKFLIDIGACYGESAFPILKNGPSPRAITRPLNALYFTQLVPTPGRIHYAPEPEGFDLDGNGYVSVAEIIDVQNNIYKTMHYGTNVLTEDPYNLLPKFYLGDLRVREDEDI
jgi:hypothetical protein